MTSLFEESRRRISKVSRLRKAIKLLKGSTFNNNIKMYYRKNAFVYQGNCIKWSKPWWCKIIAYLLSLVFVCISIFYVIIKAITLGDHKTTKWLITLILGLILENICIAPLKVLFLF